MERNGCRKIENSRSSFGMAECHCARYRKDWNGTTAWTPNIERSKLNVQCQKRLERTWKRGVEVLNGTEWP
jgi:hypothetical protein